MKRVNQTAIATASGVSVSTVSRVLSNAPGISEPVRSKVTAIARELGYKIVPPGMDRTPTLSKVILFAGTEISPSGLSLVYNSILGGIQEVAGPLGIAVSFALPGADGLLPKHILEEENVGFIFLGTDPDPDLLRALRQRGVPVVLANGLDPEMIVDSVSPANYHGSRIAARHLAERGHRKVLILSSHTRWTLKRRNEGFQAGLHEFSGDGDVEISQFELQSLSGEAVFESTAEWLKILEGGITAIFCGNDLVGLAALQVLRERGISVPGEIAVIGFDNLPLAEMCDPPLSTVDVDWRSLGAEAMRIISLRGASPEGAPRQLHLGAQLVVRQST